MPFIKKIDVKPNMQLDTKNGVVQCLSFPTNAGWEK